jgi:cysteine desulfurase
VAEVTTEPARLAGLQSLLEEGLSSGIPDLRVHGARADRVPHILAVGVPGMARDLLPSALDLEGVGASAGSACKSGSTEVSPVMLGLYGEEAYSFAPLRLSLGWSTTRAEVEEAIPRIVATVERIRAAGVGVA